MNLCSSGHRIGSIAIDPARRREEVMAAIDVQMSTGLSGLDRVFRGIMAGDNIVWQVDSVGDYVPLGLTPK
jgi:hypothetical protein